MAPGRNAADEMGTSEGSYALLGAATAHLVSLHGSGGKPDSYCPHFTMRKLAGHRDVCLMLRALERFHRTSRTDGEPRGSWKGKPQGVARANTAASSGPLLLSLKVRVETVFLLSS